MATEHIGTAKSGKGKSIEVYWNPSDRHVYVGYAGKTNIGKASSASNAIHMAQAWLADK